MLNNIMSTLAKTINVGEVMTAEGVVPKVAMVAKGAAPEVSTVEVPIELHKSPQSPKSRPTLTKEGP